MTSRTPHYLIVGEILRPHGVRGELRVRLLTDFPERLAELKTLYVGTDPMQPTATPYPVQAVRLHQEGYALLLLKGVRDRNQAELLRERYVMVRVEDAVPLDEDEYYAYQLIGLTVVTPQGRALGTVREIMETGANDVLVVDSEVYGELLLPAHGETLVDIDFERGVLTFAPPDGLLPPD